MSAHDGTSWMLGPHGHERTQSPNSGISTAGLGINNVHTLSRAFERSVCRSCLGVSSLFIGVHCGQRTYQLSQTAETLLRQDAPSSVCFSEGNKACLAIPSVDMNVLLSAGKGKYSTALAYPQHETTILGTAHLPEQNAVGQKSHFPLLFSYLAPQPLLFKGCTFTWLLGLSFPHS